MASKETGRGSATPLNIEACCFVKASELFEGYQKVWEAFCESDPNFTWGSNSRSLINSRALLMYLDVSGVKVLKGFRTRLLALPPAVLVDLEN